MRRAYNNCSSCRRQQGLPVKREKKMGRGGDWRPTSTRRKREGGKGEIGRGGRGRGGGKGGGRENGRGVVWEWGVWNERGKIGVGRVKGEERDREEGGVRRGRGGEAGGGRGARGRRGKFGEKGG